MTRWRDDEMLSAARAMTDVAPAADLEARIRARLDAVPPSRGVNFGWRWAAGMATVAAGLTMVLWVQGLQGPQGPAVQGPQGPQGAQGAPVVANLGTSAPMNPGTVNRNPGTEEHRNLGTSTGPRATVSAEVLAWESRRVPALPSIEHLSVDAMTFESIQPEPLSITPLTVTPMTMLPISGDPDRM